MVEVLQRRKEITDVEELEGLWVKVVDARADELTLKLTDGRIVKVFADYTCFFDDCSADSDPEPLLSVVDKGWKQ